MSTIQLTAYRGVVTVMTTELDAIAATTGKAITATPINNSVNLDLFADVELAVDFVSAPTAGGVIELYLLPSVDGGTVYPDGSATVLPQGSLFVGGFAIRGVTTAQVMVLRGIPLSPGLFHYVVQNTTSQAFPATGSTIRHNTYQLQSV